MLCQHSFQEWYLLQYPSDSSVSNRFQQVELFLIFKGAVIAVKLDVLALVTCFAVPHPTNAKKAKAEM
jgi:hypothetical protein